MHNVGSKLIPFYLVADVSYSMSGDPIEALNLILPTIVDEIARNPILSDKVRIGLVDFSDDARVQLPLCDVLDSNLILPRLTVRGGTSFAAPLRLLATEIPANIAQLKADGFVVHRPAVFFLTDGEPTDPKGVWESTFHNLVSRRDYPNIIPFGIGKSAEPRTLQRLIHPSTGNKQMRMFLSSKGDDAAAALRMTAEILVSSVVQSSYSITNGESGIVLPAMQNLPPGMSSYTADDDDFV